MTSSVAESVPAPAGALAAAWRRRALALAASLALVALIAFADRVTGYEIRLAILYLAPVALATWRAGGAAGSLVSLAAVLSWIWTFESSYPYSRNVYFYWEAGVSAAVFLIVVLLLTRLKQALERSDERFVAELDGLQAAVYAEDSRTARLVALGEFASAIAHELSQPLAAIATYNNTCLRLLQAGGSDAAELAEAMRKCRDQAKRAGAIIHRLREVLRHPAPALSSQDLNQVARAAIELAGPEAQQAGVALELQLAPAVPAVHADGLLIEQVALNLLRNAIEAVRGLPPARRRVTLATAPGAGGALLAVSDQGEGVPAEACERLFDPFVTTKPGGLGLGLSICRSVIEAHGGAIRYEPNAANGGTQGARFSFTLPVAQP